MLAVAAGRQKGAAALHREETLVNMTTGKIQRQCAQPRVVLHDESGHVRTGLP
jgi:hypothetical protein